MNLRPHVPVRVKDIFASRFEPEAERVLGSLYWSFLMVFFFFLIVAGISFGTYEFFRPLSSAAPPSVTVGAPAALTRAEIQKVIDGLNLRADRFDERRVAPSPVRDPS